MVTEHHIKVEAPRDQLIGTTSIVDGWPVVYVRCADGPRVAFQRFTKDYTRKSARPWKVGARGFASLDNALRSLATQ